MDFKTLTKQKWFIPAAVVVGLLIIASLVRGSGNRAAERAIEDATGGDARVDANGQVTVRTDEGEWSTNGKVPSDWPSDVPVYSGSQVQYSASANPATGGAGSYLALQSSDSTAKVAAFYKSELVSKGWTIVSTADISGGTYLSATKGDRALSLTVTPADNNSSSILIGVAKQ